ncbi:hypothetical protein CP8484711_0543B, partial [Chlamydia psittaci 84-8471/1]
DSLL